jgi:hypothetical protein
MVGTAELCGVKLYLGFGIMTAWPFREGSEPGFAHRAPVPLPL